MIEETDNYIIKPYKNRKKFELYVHNNELRSRLTNYPLIIVKEDITSLVEFRKKILFKSETYKNIILHCLHLYSKEEQAPNLVVNLEKYFLSKITKIPPHVDVNKLDMREGFLSHILKEIKRKFS